MFVLEERQPRLVLLPLDDNAIGDTSKTLRKALKETYRAALPRSVYRRQALLVETVSRIFSLLQLADNWDSYGAPSPNQRSVENALRIVDRMELQDFVTSKVVPSAEGGIGICFVQGDRYADIECTNDGEILGVRYAGQQMPALMEIDGSESSIKGALEQIRDHLRG